MSDLVTRAEFARLIKRSRSYVTRLGQEGRLVEVQTMKGRRVDVAASRALIEQTRGSRDDVAERHEEARQADAPAAARPEDDQTLTEARRSKAVSEARRLAALADQEEMNRDKQAGALIAREDVDFVLRDFGATLRSQLEGLADRLAPVVYPLTDLGSTHTAIAEAAEEVHQAIAEAMLRRAAELAGKHG